MSRHGQRLADYLHHIVEAIDRIDDYTAGLDATTFTANTLVQDTVIRNLEVIGEASRNIAREHPDIIAAYPQLPLVAAYEMRNALAHGYFQVDLHIVWRTLVKDLPPLRVQVAALLSQLPPEL
jgi:uncharacterized protein with HEPN domain